jgi:Fe-S-cluster containining protein
MLSLLVIVVVSFLVCVVLAIVASIDFAIRGEQTLAERREAASRWRPPFLRGADLFGWAKETAQRMVGFRLAKEQTAGTPVKLAAEIQEGATRAMLPLAAEADIVRRVPCPDEGQGMIGVTVPEVLEIADYIRRTATHAERKRIHALARENARQMANPDDTQISGAETPCPLQGDDRVCCVYSARPLRCRPLHAALIARRLGLQADAGADQNSPWANHEETVERGAEQGLTQGLRVAGLDANVYELNSALVIALDKPDADQRWMQGENLFAVCQLYREGIERGVH